MVELAAMGSWSEKGLNRGMAIVWFYSCELQRRQIYSRIFAASVYFLHDNVVENLGSQEREKG